MIASCAAATYTCWPESGQGAAVCWSGEGTRYEQSLVVLSDHPLLGVQSSLRCWKEPELDREVRQASVCTLVPKTLGVHPGRRRPSDKSDFNGARLIEKHPHLDFPSRSTREKLLG